MAHGCMALVWASAFQGPLLPEPGGPRAASLSLSSLRGPHGSWLHGSSLGLCLPGAPSP